MEEKRNGSNVTVVHEEEVIISQESKFITLKLSFSL
jgi:hypothetical protein